MKVVVIGGKGHIGTYLVPRLVEAGHEVSVVTRGQRAPYAPHPAWREVTQVTIDRARAEQKGTFGPRIATLGPEVHRRIMLGTFALSAGQTGTYNLICYHYGTGSPSSQVGDPVLTAIFTPAP